MAESMREAVEGFERGREKERMRQSVHAWAFMHLGQRILCSQLAVAERVRVKLGVPNAAIFEGDFVREEPEPFYMPLEDATHRIVLPKSGDGPRFRRADVLDLVTAANDARQLAIASPKLAEQAALQATRLSDLAERIAMLLGGGE